jgi:RNA polymerase sigma-70 factor, ECF subfamily
MKLAERLIAKLADRSGELTATTALEAKLADLCDAGEARLAHKPVKRDAFVDRIAGVLLTNDDELTLAMLDKFQPADLYLACALAAKDERAVAVLEAELMPAARQSAGRVDSTQSFVDEVCQRVRDRLLVGDGESPPAIVQYRGTGPLGRWVRVVASRIALDIKRADSKVDDDSDDAISQLPAPGDPELQVIWQTCAAEYKAALSAVFAGLSKRERNLMRQRYLDDLNIDALGRLYRVHPATAFRWLKQIEEKIATSTREALMTKLVISEGQVHSIERMVASQLQLSLPRMLRGKPTKSD